MTNENDFDICIFCALPEEGKALMDVFGPLIWQKFIDQSIKRDCQQCIIENSRKEKLKIHLSWLPRYGPVEMAIHGTMVLSHHRNLRMALMAGFCAGNKNKEVQLGDLIAADCAWPLDAGKALLGSSGRTKIVNDQRLTAGNISSNLRHFLQSFDNWKYSVNQELRPRSQQEQRDKLLQKLNRYRYSSLKDIPERWLQGNVPSEEPIVRQLKLGPNPILSKDGTVHRRNLLLKIKQDNSYPFQDNEHCDLKLGTIASTTAVRRDDTFDRLKTPHNDTLAIDMEGHAFYRAAEEFKIPALLVKGVCDYADPDKDDTYHKYAARVSARYILSFIKEYVTNERLPRLMDGRRDSAIMRGHATRSSSERKEAEEWDRFLCKEQSAVMDTECAWIMPWPQSGKSPLDVELFYQTTFKQYQRYDHTVGSIPLLLKTIGAWKDRKPDKWEELDAEPWGCQVRLESVMHIHGETRVRIVLSPSKFLFYPSIHEQLALPGLRQLRKLVFRNATQLKPPLLLPSTFALHMGVISNDGYLLLRRRQTGELKPYAGAWEVGIGEFMHGPLTKAKKSDFPKGRPNLTAFLRRAVSEELKYNKSQAPDFRLYGFAVERETLAPKLLVLCRLAASIDELMDGAMLAEDPALSVAKVKLSPTAIARVVCDTDRFRTWGPTSKLTMMLAITADLTQSERSKVLRDVHDAVLAIQKSE